ncbi:MAG TPA: UDP-N-acetylmuramoyl-tripeptide--D-alanyl-D-alanine ligase [Vicinamibacterales bacterium]|nr:UDP-N-acetylmuramoyl-tripeptide--D-alanyl-D-alanine ligase [Vicinamibacterales bacterium]
MGTAGAIVLTAGLVAEATGGRLVSGSPDVVFSSASIDTRTLQPGALFVALQGARDGEVFVGHALERGAAGLLVSRVRPEIAAGPVAVIVVPDTLVALQALGQHVRRRCGARLVAITGSAGKTTTKELTAHVLATRYRVYRSRGNFNNHIGLPLSLIELTEAPEVAVVELGMNRAGEIRRLVEIAEPDVRVWTNVGDAHIGSFGSSAAIAAAKAEILERPTPGMVVVANADDALVMEHVRAVRTRTITFGEDAAATVRLSGIVDRGLDGTAATIDTPAGAVELHLALPGRMHLWNAAAATAVAFELDVPVAEVAARLGSVRPVHRRGGQLTLPSGIRIVDDSYNASPEATVAMLEALGRTATTGRRVAVLGEMLELGSLARERHERCGRVAAGAGTELLIVIGGPAADGLVDGAVAGGMPHDRIHRFGDAAAAADAVHDLLRPNDLVLVKGSRGTRTDVVADRIGEAA